jgi:hypothetical protein
MRRLMIEAANTSETSVNYYRTTRRNNPDDSRLQKLDDFQPRKFSKCKSYAAIMAYFRISKETYSLQKWCCSYLEQVY